LPIISLAFVSMLIMACPCFANSLRFFSIYSNCVFLSAFSSLVNFLPPFDIFLLLHRREYFNFLINFPTVFPLTLIPIRANCSAIFLGVLLIQFNPAAIGSPAFSYFRSSSILFSTSGIFF